MDGEVLLKRVYKISDEVESRLKSFKKQYDIISAEQMDSGMTFACQEERDTSITAAGITIRSLDKIRQLDKEVVGFSGALQNKMQRVLPDSPVKLKRLLVKKTKCKPLIPNGNYELSNTYYKTARHINALNVMLARLELIAQEIEKIIDRKAIKIEYVDIVEYNGPSNTLKMNGRKMIIGDRSAREHAMLEVFFGSKRRNLVSRDIDDADVFEAIKDVDPEKYIDEAKQRKCALDTYKILNNKIREIIPSGDDIIMRIDNGFALNPRLKK